MQAARDPVVVMCGQWRCADNGEWDFTVEKRRMGRCININGMFESYSDFSEHVKKEFDVDASIVAMFTFWVPTTMIVVEAVRNPLVVFAMDVGFSNYKAMRCANKQVNLFVEFADSNSPNCVHALLDVEKHLQKEASGTDVAVHVVSRRLFVDAIDDLVDANRSTVDYFERVFSLAGDDEFVFEDEVGEDIGDGDEPASDEEFEDSDRGST